MPTTVNPLPQSGEFPSCMSADIAMQNGHYRYREFEAPHPGGAWIWEPPPK